ncbi:MAG: hypothetical protein KDD45_18215 [Bdellovibrionales bacterium]|nr:hypothetical protein [Bdellovibrionales bacterium]
MQLIKQNIYTIFLLVFIFFEAKALETNSSFCLKEYLSDETSQSAPCLNCLTSRLPILKTLMHGIPIGAKSLADPINYKDKALWRNSYNNRKEMAYWQILKIDGTSLHSELIIGESNHINGFQIKEAFNKLLAKINKNEISTIEFTHTHPGFVRPGSYGLVAEFSPQDILLSQFWRKSINSLGLDHVKFHMFLLYDNIHNLGNKHKLMKIGFEVQQ